MPSEDKPDALLPEQQPGPSDPPQYLFLNPPLNINTLQCMNKGSHTSDWSHQEKLSELNKIPEQKKSAFPAPSRKVL